MALASARAGGNSKTAIISNISPADSNFGETLSTLKFAQRAKLIKTRAILNEDTNGSSDQLRAEIKRLKADIAALKGAAAAAAGADNDAAARRSSVAGAGGGVDAGARERISELENLLYQCMEAQQAAEERCEKLVAVKAEALDRADTALSADSELFASLKMQLKLKTESIKFLSAKKEAPPAPAAGAGAEGGVDAESQAALAREVEELRSENAALRKAAAAPIGDHPEFRQLQLALGRADLAMRSDGQFVVHTSSTKDGLVKLLPNTDLVCRCLCGWVLVWVCI